MVTHFLGEKRGLHPKMLKMLEQAIHAAKITKYGRDTGLPDWPVRNKAARQYLSLRRMVEKQENSSVVG